MTRQRLLMCIVLFAVAVSVGCAQPQRLLLPIEKDAKWGYIDSSGSVVVSPQFVHARAFSEGLAAVAQGTPDRYRWGYIMSSGAYRIKPQFSLAGEFHEGRALVVIGTKVGYIDSAGRTVISPRYDIGSEDYSDGLAMVRVTVGKSTKFGYVNRAGRFVIPPRFVSARGFSEGLAAVAIGRKWGYIDKTGRVVVEPRFESAESFSEGLALITMGGVGASRSTRGDKALGAARLGDAGYIDRTGRIAIRPREGLVMPFSEGLAPAYQGHSPKTWRWGYIDKKGKWVIKPAFSWANGFSEGLAAVTVRKRGEMSRAGYIDRRGRMVIKPKFGSMGAGDFHGGVAPVSFDPLPAQDAGPSYVDKTGKPIWIAR